MAPDYLPAQLRLGELLRTVGDWDESGKVYREVVRQHPDSARAHYGLGRVQFARGETRAALKSYRTASRLAPDFGAAHYGLGTVYRSLGEDEKARRHLLLFQRTQRNPPPLADPLLDSLRRLQSKAEYHYLRGLGFQRRGQIPEAHGEFERALKEDPRHAGAHANLFFSFLTLGDLVKAEEHYQAAHRLDPRLHEIHHNLGILRTLQKRDREAEEAFRKALELNPFRADSHYLLGANLDNAGQAKEAEEHFRLAIENRSQFMDAHFQLGRLLQKQGRDAEAIGHFLKTLTVEDERTPVCLYVLAHSYARLGKTDKAIETAVQAREKAFSRGNVNWQPTSRSSCRGCGRQANGHERGECLSGPAVPPMARRPAAGRTPLGSLGLAVSRSTRPVEPNSPFLGSGFPGGAGFQALQRGRRQVLPA